MSPSCPQMHLFLIAASLLPTHIKGKKHQRLLNLRQEREKSCKKSIYVCGFQNSGSIEEELTDYFSAYGKVSNIFVDKDKVDFSFHFSGSIYRYNIHPHFSDFKNKCSYNILFFWYCV